MSTKKYSKSRREGWMTIPEFFDGKCVFITGATGFLGKVLVEKLLRSCPGVEKIYILMRPKKGKSLEERLSEMISLPLFVKVKREDPKSVEKIIPLKGDVCEKNLGLSVEDRETLIKDVSVVFHVAASVRFDDPLKQAILMNTRGTLEILTLAKQMKNLESFIHVSTTYCNIHQEVIEESIYPPPGDWRALIKLAETMDQHTLEVFAPKILGTYPNTYTFTKGLAEHLVKEFKDDIPVVIFRPSIVISSYLEPMPGWIDNFNGPVGLLIASGKGIVKIVYSDPKISADYVPVDIAVTALVVTAWHRAMDREDTLPIYNCSSYGIKSITQTELVKVAKYVVHQVPLNDLLWIPTTTITGCKFMYYLCVLIFHIIPAIVIDTGLKLANKKPMLLKLQRKIFVANMALAYFLTKQWSFKNDKLLKLVNDILDSDLAAFCYRVENVDVVEYFTRCTYGAREYLLKEDNTELPEAKRHYKRMYWLDRGLKLMFLAFMAYVVHRMQVLPIIRSYISQLINLFVKHIVGNIFEKAEGLRECRSLHYLIILEKWKIMIFVAQRTAFSQDAFFKFFNKKSSKLEGITALALKSHKERNRNESEMQ